MACGLTDFYYEGSETQRINCKTFKMEKQSVDNTKGWNYLKIAHLT